MRTDFIETEHIENNLAGLDSMLSGSMMKVEDYLKITMLVKIYDTLQEIKEELKSKS